MERGYFQACGSRFSGTLNADETAALAEIRDRTGESKSGAVKQLVLAAVANTAAG